MTTMAELFDRQIISDTDASTQRYSDADLLRYANDWLRQMRRDEPDLFIGSYLTDFTPLQLTDTFPLPSGYEPLCAAYVVALAEARDDEHVNTNRAAQFFTLSKRPK